MSAKRHGLGRGIDSVISKPSADHGGLLTLPINTIEPNPQQPRSHFDEVGLEELAASIREHGILQPLVVTHAGPGRYQLIAGERRWRAAQVAGLAEIPVVVKEATQRDALLLALVENIQRADLDPLEEARAFNALHRDFNLTHKEIGERVGKSREAITNTLRLLSLPSAAQQMVSDGDLTAGHVRALMRLEKSHLQQAIQEVVTHNLTVRQAETLARLVQEGHPPAQARKLAVRPSRSSASAPQPKSAQELSVEDQSVKDTLQRMFGTKVELHRQGKGGRITIWFYNQEQLEMLYERLSCQEED